ncbi:hypothetical protein GCM10011365_18620 [Marinicella pacifica]|uniref:DUF2288 domain-containing protein n=1 Tax=Marinicella pacifica TaxID=1171543 RepID=A0A917CSK2_9GAMM|nr:DUF2288 family protein [Marinicella pacifica]GGF97472.1 hypothetical protein GCM10011365_18620 [Marinicella pacifica]
MTNNNKLQPREPEDIRSRLLKERGPIDYLEVQKFFAKGVILVVDAQLDLVDVAEKVHADDTACIEEWINDKLVIRAHDEHAKKWLDNNSRFEAVTMMPWVLVQEINQDNDEKTQ